MFYIERAGNLKLRDNETGLISNAGSLSVDSGREDGLIGIVLDPNFATNSWLYLFYSPTGVSEQRVSRFDFDGSSIDISSEKIMLRIPVQREQCCHSGGDMEFDSNGNLYIATGDNTNPFESDGFTPIDERAGRSAFDAQTTQEIPTIYVAKFFEFIQKMMAHIPFRMEIYFPTPAKGNPKFMLWARATRLEWPLVNTQTS